MARPTPSHPGRALTALLVVLLALFGAVGWTALREGGQWTPKLGLDLEGGTSIALIPRAESGGAVTDDSIRQAVEIIRARVDSFGVSEAEVAAQGRGSSQTILISVPQKQGENILETVSQTAQLRFRPVINATGGGPAPDQPAGLSPVPLPSGSGSPAPSPSDSGSPAPSPSGSARSATPAPSTTTQGRVIPEAFRQAAAPSATPSGSASPSGSADPAAPSGQPSEPAAAGPGGPGEPSPELLERFVTLDCTRPENRIGVEGPAEQTIVACSQDGAEKYLLGPAALQGTDVSEANAGLATNSQGQPIPGSWQVQLDFTDDGARRWADFTTANVGQQVAVVLDGQVVSAPSINEPITGGNTQISGSFTQQEASELANVLRYGSLPLTFDPGTAQEISPELGSDQLRAGLLAGGLGLLLVVAYSLLYYRGLGLVNVVSLAISGALTYATVVLLGNTINLRLSLAGVAGLIVGIGIAADSFIVYFERLRDEVRDGRTLRVAVEAGWRRARRTVLAADFVSFLAAAVLYVLSVGAVRGFAVTLLLATVVDVLVVFLFTKPLVTLLARTKFFGGGHPLSGLDMRRLGGQERPAPGWRRTRPGRPAPATTIVSGEA